MKIVCVVRLIMENMALSGKTIEEKVEGYCGEAWNILALNYGKAIVSLPYIPQFQLKISKY